MKIILSETAWKGVQMHLNIMCFIQKFVRTPSVEKLTALLLFTFQCFSMFTKKRLSLSYFSQKQKHYRCFITSPDLIYLGVKKGLDLTN